MPTYDYICTNCSYTFEAFQKMSDAHLTTCPECAGLLQRKIGGGTGLHFKGSGFYITDYAKKQPTKNKTPETAKPKKDTAKKKDKKS